MAFLPLSFRRVNVSQWGDASKCWNSLLKQKSYIVVLTIARGPDFRSKGFDFRSEIRRKGHFRPKYPALRGRYDDDFGAAVVYDVDTERKILKALGKKPRNCPFLRLAQ